jgi:hypothetical protein
LIALVAPYLASRPALLTASAAGLALGGRLLLPGSWYSRLTALGGSLVGAMPEARRC